LNRKELKKFDEDLKKVKQNLKKKNENLPDWIISQMSEHLVSTGAPTFSTATFSLNGTQHNNRGHRERQLWSVRCQYHKTYFSSSSLPTFLSSKLACFPINSLGVI
jgi:hypothetical protein